MGGGSSRPKRKPVKPAPPPPPPPVVVQKPYPGGDPFDPSKPPPNAITNLSASQAEKCKACDLLIDTQVSTSGVTLTRDEGNVSWEVVNKSGVDYDNVQKGRLSVGDYLTNLQNGKYVGLSALADKQANTYLGSYFAQLKISESDAAKITTKDDVKKLMETWNNPNPTAAGSPTLIGGTVRKVTATGGFSSETKAKFKLSIPVKIKYVSKIETTPKYETSWLLDPIRPITKKVDEESPVFKELTISMFTIYHPSPLRIENVQHDAVLSLNDPSDETSVNGNGSAVILIPLKASNNVDESVDFFSKIARYLPTVSAPTPKGTYADTNIPTGRDWSVKKLFHFPKPEEDKPLPQFSTILDGFYSWTGVQEYTPTETRIGNQIIRDWKPTGEPVRYFMVDEPISISTSDLSYLTRSLPPTPPAQAIHSIPEKSTILYKPAVCGDKESFTTLREGMANQSTGSMLGSLFTGGTVDDLMVDSKGIPIADKDTCDPFKNNLKSAMKKPSFFTPAKFFAMFFNVLILVAIAFGAWLAMYLIANKDYDGKYRELSEMAGKVVGKLALQTSGKIREASQRIASLKSLASGEVPEAANLAESIDGKLPDLKALAPGGKIPGLPSGLGSLASGFLKKA